MEGDLKKQKGGLKELDKQNHTREMDDQVKMILESLPYRLIRVHDRPYCGHYSDTDYLKNKK
jgi:hypothetical protein